jgi:hypothetical protein
MNPVGIRLCCILTVMLFVGCANQLQFRVVDASSRQALSGVNVRVQKRSLVSYLDRTPHEHEVGWTDTNGVIAVPNCGSKELVYFSLSGYYGAAAGFVEGGKIGIGPYPPRDIDAMSLERKVVERRGIIIIPLLPVSTNR